ncbi:MAG TPA: universal stress protein [Candidatus Binatia bacterium]|nr:universal stress protein [Candidatus Binatia bacterium]
MLFSRIAVAIDDSEPSERAAAFAIRLAVQEHGSLTLIHAVDWVSAVSTLEAGLSVADPSPIIDALRTEGRALLAKASAEARAAGLTCDEQLAEARPIDAILGAAKQADALVIVMGTHGRGGIGRVILGSVAEGVLRASEIPVLTIHPTDTLPAAPQRLAQNVLVAVDGSDPSDAAVRVAVTQLPKEGRRTTFCFNIDHAAVEDTFGEHPAEVRERLEGISRLALDRALEYAREYQVPAEGVLVEGNTVDSIVAEANRRSADMIVLGSHGRKGLERLFLGSVAEGVLRKAKVPVLIVRG